MDRYAQKGFTLVELIVTLAVAGILLALGVPSFVEAVRESRISTQYNQMVGSLFLARSEAVKRRRFVTVCPRSSTTSKDCGSARDWKNGWLVFVDNKVDLVANTASLDAEDELLSVEPGLAGDNTISVFGTPAGNSTTIADRAYVRYQSPGDTSWNAASVVICDAVRGAESSRAVNIVLTGDIRRGRKDASDHIARDVFNRSLATTCTAS